MSSIRVPSDTVPGQSYKVEVRDGQGVCDCPGYLTHAHCKHVKEVLMENNGDDRALVTVEDAEAEPTSLALHAPTRLLPTMDELTVMGKIAATLVKAAGHAIPKSVDSAPKAAAIMLAGWEIGLRPMTAFRHIFVVNGRTELDAQAMMGLVKAGDKTADFVFHRYDGDACDVELRRNGRKVARCLYSMEDARKSGQTRTDSGEKGTWRGFPRDMLAWAAVKRVCRLGAPDLINAFSQISVSEADALISGPDDGAEPEAVPLAVQPAPASPDTIAEPEAPWESEADLHAYEEAKAAHESEQPGLPLDPRGDPTAVTPEDLP